MTDFKIRRGLSTSLYEVSGSEYIFNPRLIIEEGCWYLCTDTAELFLGTADTDGKLVLKRINEFRLGEVELDRPLGPGVTNPDLPGGDLTLNSVINVRINEFGDLIVQYSNGQEETVGSTVGASAFQIAQDNGFEGTEADWLKSLSGVYVGSGEPSEAYQVQIIPNGTADALNVVKYTTQSLTEAEKEQARYNIGAFSKNEVPTLIDTTLSEATKRGDFKGERGEPGIDGNTPYIGQNLTWWIGETDTGIMAQGVDGTNGTNGSVWYACHYPVADIWDNIWISKNELSTYVDRMTGSSEVHLNDFFIFTCNNTIGMCAEITDYEIRIQWVTQIPINLGVKRLDMVHNGSIPIPQIVLSDREGKVTAQQFPLDTYSIPTGLSNMYTNNMLLDFQADISTITVTLSNGDTIPIVNGASNNVDDFVHTYFTAAPDTAAKADTQTPMVIDLAEFASNYNSPISNISIAGWCTVDYGIFGIELYANGVPAILSNEVLKQPNTNTASLGVSISSSSITARSDLAGASMPHPTGYDTAGISISASLLRYQESIQSDTVTLAIKTIFGNYLPIIQFINGRWGDLPYTDVSEKYDIKVCGAEYTNNMNYFNEIYEPGATAIEVTFDTNFQTEGCDYLYIEDCNGNEIARYSGDYIDPSIRVAGDCIRVRFETDGSVSNIDSETGEYTEQFFGFKINSVLAYK